MDLREFLLEFTGHSGDSGVDLIKSGPASQRLLRESGTRARHVLFLQPISGGLGWRRMLPVHP